MAKLSDLIQMIDDEIRDGDKDKALKMIDKLLEKVPDHAQLVARRQRLGRELDLDMRITRLEEKYGVAARE
jgi:hypothetical protein